MSATPPCTVADGKVAKKKSLWNKYVWECELEVNELHQFNLNPPSCVNKPSLAVTNPLPQPGQRTAAAWAAAADCNCSLSDGKWQIAPLIISNELRQKTDTQACKHNYDDMLGGRRVAREHIWSFHETASTLTQQVWIRALDYVGPPAPTTPNMWLLKYSFFNLSKSPADSLVQATDGGSESAR